MTSDPRSDAFGLRIAPAAQGLDDPPPSRRIPRRRMLTGDDFIAGVRAGDRAILARTISLIESTHASHRTLAQEVITALLPHTGRAHRVGITGVPGVGKSTFIEALGTHLTAQGHRVAVLAVDPSSTITGGSILGDKTRMAKLSVDPRAFIRPSPTSGALGGVASHTRETLLVCEAAGFDVILVETVGVGQSETAVSGMVDFFLALMLPGAGDELQGIKRGLIELVDMIAINKADGDTQRPADAAARQYAHALHYMRHRDPAWTPPVVTCSALTGARIDTLWTTVEQRLTAMRTSGLLEARRREQREVWLDALLVEGLRRRFEAAPSVAALRAELTAAVRDGSLAPVVAAERLLQLWEDPPPEETP